jgi:hypothetical protein
VIKNLQEKLTGMIRTHFSGAIRQSVPLLLAIGFALAARFDSDSLHQPTEIRLASLQGSAQKIDLTSFCPMLKYVNEGISLHFKTSVPHDFKQYEIFDTSQGDGGIRFIVNRDRQLVAEHGSNIFALSEPIARNSAKGIDLDIKVTMMINPQYEADQLVVFKAVNPENQEKFALMLPTEFDQIICDNEGFIGLAAPNSMITITAQGYITPAAQEASRSTILFRALGSLSLSFWLAMKWINRKQLVMGNHD